MYELMINARMQQNFSILILNISKIVYCYVVLLALLLITVIIDKDKWHCLVCIMKVDH